VGLQWFLVFALFCVLGAIPALAEQPGNYTVIARRYRPVGFEDLIGQEHIASALKNAVSSGRIAHAYLFTGVRGVGKTSVARILARALNCVNGPTPDPCGKCEICQAITSGEDVDVLEIDGASNRGIDRIREIRSNVQYLPSRARFKIFIIDEVHMLTEEAFNALLKTLEEPPPHVKFFFATTDPQDIPITILSRCQRFNLAGIPQDKILEHLKLIVKKEKMKADEDALRLIARRAAGSMRDAQSLLDQLLAFSGGDLTTEAVRQLLGSADDERMGQIASAVLADNIPELLGLVEKCVSEGLPLVELLDQLIAYWRDLMAIHLMGEQAPGLTVGPSLKSKILEQVKGLTLDQVTAGMDLLAANRQKMKFSPLPRSLVEVALVRLARLKELIPLSQLAQAVGQGTMRLGSGSAPQAAPPPARPTPAMSYTATGPVKKNDLKTPESPSSEVPQGVISPASPRMRLALDRDSLVSVWAETLSKVGGLHERELRRGTPKLLGERAIVLSFGLSQENSWSYCNEGPRIKRVEEALFAVTGEVCSIRFEQDGSVSPELVVPKSAPAVDRQQISSAKEAMARAEANPVVKRAVDLFDGKIVRVDEDFGKE